MKKWKIGLFIILTVAVFTACASKATTESKTINDLTPEQTVQDAFDAVKQKDFDKFNQYMANSSIFITEDADSYNQLTNTEKKIMNELFLNFSYEISSTKIDGSKATINVKMTNTDYSNIITDLVKQSINSTFSGDEEDMDDDNSEELLLNLLSEANKSNSKVSSDLELKLNKTDTGWKIDLDSKARNVLLGNLVDIF